MTGDNSVKELPDGEWENVFTATEVSKPWEPIAPKEGGILFIQNGQGKFLKYLFMDGRYNLIDTVDWNNKA